MLQFVEVHVTQSKYLLISVRYLGLIFKDFKHIDNGPIESHLNSQYNVSKLLFPTYVKIKEHSILPNAVLFSDEFSLMEVCGFIPHTFIKIFIPTAW